MQTQPPISKVVTWFHLGSWRDVYSRLGADAWRLTRYYESSAPAVVGIFSTREVRRALSNARHAFTSGALVEREAGR